MTAPQLPTAPRGPGRPRTGITPKRNIRVGQLWEDAEGLAHRQGKTMTQLVHELLEAYVAECGMRRQLLWPEAVRNVAPSDAPRGPNARGPG